MSYAGFKNRDILLILKFAMVSICVTCSVQGPYLSPLSDEYWQLLHAIVSPVVNMMELRSYPLLVCVNCKLLMDEVHKFHRMAQRGVQALKSLFSVPEIRPPVVHASFFRPILEAKPEPLTIKIDPENDMSTIKQQCISVPASRDKNPLSEEIDLKFEPESTCEADYGSNVSRNVERIPDLLSHPDPFMARNGSVESNESSFTGMQQITNNVHSNFNVIHSNQPNQISTQMRKTVRKENSVNSIQVAKFVQSAKNGQNLSSIRIRNPMDLQQNVSPNWIVAENAAKVDSNDSNFEVFTHEARKKPDILSRNSKQGIRKVKRIRINPDVTCAHCEKIFKGKESLKIHIERKHLGLKCFSCETCGKSFSSKQDLQRHIKRNHERPKETTVEDMNPVWFCAECAIQFSSRSSYKTHLMSLKHKPKEPYTIVCETCEKRFPTHRGLQEHVNFVHKKKFKCEICEKTYGKKHLLVEHVQVAHEKQAKNRPHVCHLCGKAFAASKTLGDHLNSHQGLRPYECKLCPATFSHKAALFTHNRLKHLKMKKKNKEAKINDTNVEKGRKRKRKVKKAADKVEGVEIEAGG